MEWISVKDRLPENNEWVLVRYCGGNWSSDNSFTGKHTYKIVKFEKGITIEEREKLKGTERYRLWKSEDQGDNNKYAYRWNTFGALSMFSQEVDFWMPLPEPPK